MKMTRVLALVFFLWATLPIQGQAVFACGMHGDAVTGEARNPHQSNNAESSHSPDYRALEYDVLGQPAGPGLPCHKSCCTAVHAAQCDTCLSGPVIHQDGRTPAIPLPAAYTVSFSDDASPACFLADPFPHKYRIPVYLATKRLRI
jgi:hypothetical protein